MSGYGCLVITCFLEYNPFKCSSSWTFKCEWKCLSIHTDRFLISHLKVQEEEHVLYCREKIRLENTWKHSGDWDKCSDGQWRDWCAGVLTWLLWFSDIITQSFPLQINLKKLEFLDDIIFCSCYDYDLQNIFTCNQNCHSKKLSYMKYCSCMARLMPMKYQKEERFYYKIIISIEFTHDKV